MSAAVFPLHRYKSSRLSGKHRTSPFPPNEFFFSFHDFEMPQIILYIPLSLLATGLSSSTPPLSFSEEFRRLESESFESARSERRFEMISFQVSSSKRRDVEEKPTAVDVGPLRSRFTLWKGKCQVLFARAVGAAGTRSTRGDDGVK